MFGCDSEDPEATVQRQWHLTPASPDTGPSTYCMMCISGFPVEFWGPPVTIQVSKSFSNCVNVGLLKDQHWPGADLLNLKAPVATAVSRLAAVEDTMALCLHSALNHYLYSGQRGCHTLLTWKQQCPHSAKFIIHMIWHCSSWTTVIWSFRRSSFPFSTIYSIRVFYVTGYSFKYYVRLTNANGD